MGMIYTCLNRHEDSLISFSNAVYNDQYLAIAYFQAGVSRWVLEDYEGSIEMFDAAEILMRGNNSIDYRQLGLDYQLYQFEIFFNRAISFFYMGDSQNAINDLHKTVKVRVIDEHYNDQYHPDTVIEHWKVDNLDEYAPFCVPQNLIFRPSEDKIKSSEKIDYLGQSRVIASLDEDDNFTGFAGPKIRKALVSLEKRISQIPEIDDTEGSELKRPQRLSQIEAGIDAAERFKGLSIVSRDPGIQEENRNFEDKKRVRPPMEPRTPKNLLDSRKQHDPFQGIQNNSRQVNQSRPSNRTLRREHSDPRENSRTATQNFPISTLEDSFGYRGDDLDLDLGSYSNMRSPVSRILDANLRETILPEETNTNTDNLPHRHSAGRDSSTSKGSKSGKIKVKCYRDDGDTFAVMLDEINCSYRQLHNRVAEKCGTERFRLKYKDDDGEYVLMADDEDLDMAIAVYHELNEKKLVLKITQ